MTIVGIETANRRRDRRVDTYPLLIELDGKAFPTIDWSLGGFRIEGYDGRRRRGEEITVRIVVRAGESRRTHVARAEIVRRGIETGQLAANFILLDNDTLETLEGWMTGRLRRHMLKTARQGKPPLS